MKLYETIIGLEVHVELASKTKIFCGCSTEFGALPNTHICPVCAGMPGALPVLNKKAVEMALSVGLAANCKVNQKCRFDRKNYFYPDNPQNYQISQLYLPICYEGYLEIQVDGREKKVRIHEIHMEEDAGKLIHDQWGDCSLVDYNRSGVPLIEIVTEPDMESSEEVIAFLEKLRIMIQYLEASDCRLQEGSMRVDVNLSVRQAGSSCLGTRTEMKNLNSFKAISRAIEGEKQRQIELLEEGKQVKQETRRWDDNKENSYPMRSKEDARDYRYFPDPDLPLISISHEWLEKIRFCQPEMSWDRAKRFQREYGLSEYDSTLITESKKLSDIFEETVKFCGNAKKAANWIIGETMRLMKERKVEAEKVCFSAEHLAELIEMTENGAVNGKSAKNVFEKIFQLDVDPKEYIREHELGVVNDQNAVKEAVTCVLKENHQSVNEYLMGKEKVMGFLIGQVMKKLKGKGDPDQVKKILKDQLK